MTTHTTGTIIRVTGPLVKAKGLAGAKMFEVVRVSNEKLMGEIIELQGDVASIQVYEDTAGIGPGEPVELTGKTLSVELGPGLLESFYDGIQRPLKVIQDESKSHFIARGIDASGIDRKKQWEFKPVKKAGDTVEAGDILGTVQETTLIEHRIMVPYGVRGTIKDIKGGNFTVEETVATISTEEGDENIAMLSYWPIRTPRPTNGKIFPDEPLVTGGRSVDTFFPIAKGGAGCIPGAFGTGKTVTQQSVAKYCDAQVIIYVGCGERGNEMTEVLEEFPHLKDPNTGEPLMKRTVLVANTSNMPVAAREASVYTGITIAEYYRDMGYSVAMMADSTSRWAEAMREISGRLEEMPGEEGYPAYLASRTASFYERAGRVNCLGSEGRDGALTVIGAVSPPGGDLSEPVSQTTLRVTKTFWGLDAGLAYKKHFPTINWLNSYSLYVENFSEYWKKNIAPDFGEVRRQAMELLQKEAKLMEIVRLVGMESLSGEDKLTLEVARAIREDFLYQDAFDPEDARTPLAKQYNILKSMIVAYREGLPVVTQNEFEFSRFTALPFWKEMPRIKTYKESEEFEAFQKQIEREVRELQTV